MAKEICISSTPHETRLAILEDDQLAEIYYERENEYTLAGSIYNGRVTRVLPGMQSAFVDIGLERDAFLYVTDFMELEDQEETDELEKAAVSGANQAPREVRHTNGQRPGRPEPHPERESRPTIEITSESSDADFAAPAAIVLGSEARGLSPLWTASDITPISLPMLGSVDSLNLSATAAVLFYEALRQRNAAVPSRPNRG